MWRLVWEGTGTWSSVLLIMVVLVMVLGAAPAGFSGEARLPGASATILASILSPTKRAHGIASQCSVARYRLRTKALLVGY